MKKLLLLLLFVPLIGYTISEDISKGYEYYIGDVEIFEDDRYIQIKHDSSKIYFTDIFISETKDTIYYPGIVVFDTSYNGQRILEYKYVEYPHGEIPWEKREWYTSGILKYEFIRHDGKFSSTYISEKTYSDKGDLISERKLKPNGEEAGWWYRNVTFSANACIGNKNMPPINKQNIFII